MDRTNLVLIVEDDKDLREAICETVRLSNFDVMEACSAEEAARGEDEDRGGGRRAGRGTDLHFRHGLRDG